MFHLTSYITKGVCVCAYIITICFCMSGCSKPDLSTAEQHIEFRKAGPIRPTVDNKHFIKSKIPLDEYRVIVGDVLQFNMPADLWVTDPDLSVSYERDKSHLCRVNKSGTINLPIIGQISAAGKTLPEIEALIEKAYYPKYISYPPSVVGEVARHHTQNLTVLGAVTNPGIYPCRSDEMSLVSLLMKAGGVVDDGAAVIRINRSESSNDVNEPLVLPIKGLNIPFDDVALYNGDVVEVEQLKPEVFTVIGLVERPNTFPYPANAQYNLLQAVAFAGGVNDVADPQYLRVYRQKDDGEIVDVTLKIGDKGISDISNINIKPGDVISVEQTSRTRNRLLFAEIFRVTFGVNVGGVYRYLEGRDVTTRESN